VLVVDRDSAATQSLIAFLRSHGFEVLWALDGESAFNVLAARTPDCLVTELRAPRIDGLAVLERARAGRGDACAVVVAERGDIAMAVEAMRRGAYDFQVQPLQLDKLLAVLRRGLEHQALAARATQVEEQLDERLALDRLTGPSRAIQRVMEQVRAIASTRSTVLIEGERGAGKGLVAQAIHRHSPRRTARFVAVSCALGGEVLEGELFGHERDGAQPGRLELAEGGTLFLDAIGDAPPSVQMKLLRVMQDRAFERVGGTQPMRADVRLLAATDRDLAAEVRDGRFREDLFYRLSVVRVRIPPLRERPEDIPPLVEEFLRAFNLARGRSVTGITRGALERLVSWPWPGNVRELKHTIEGMVVFAEGRRALDLSDLPAPLRPVEDASSSISLTVGMTVSEAERRLIVATLQHTGNDKPRAAAMLGIGLRTLYRKIREFGLR